jgi:hypothetical protein
LKWAPEVAGAVDGNDTALFFEEAKRQERKRWRMCEWGWMVKSLARGDKNRTIAPLTMDKNSSLSTAFSRLLFTPQLSYQSKNLPSTAAKTL